MSKKVLDNKNRWRSKTVAFRVSPEEWDEIERLVAISGMKKQEYIMHRLQNKEINVTANPRIFKALKDLLKSNNNNIFSNNNSIIKIINHIIN